MKERTTKMAKEMENVKEVINNEINAYATLMRNRHIDLVRYGVTYGSQVLYFDYMSDYSARLEELYYLARRFELIDGVDYFREAVQEYIFDKRDICPTTDDFKLDETEMF